MKCCLFAGSTPSAQQIMWYICFFSVTALLVVLLVILGVTVFVQTFHQNDSDQVIPVSDRNYQRNFTLIKKEIPIATMNPDYSRQIKGNQFQEEICQNITDKKFTVFAIGFIGSSYQQLFYDIRDLKCFYVRIYLIMFNNFMNRIFLVKFINI